MGSTCRTVQERGEERKYTAIEQAEKNSGTKIEDASESWAAVESETKTRRHTNAERRDESEEGRGVCVCV